MSQNAFYWKSKNPYTIVCLSERISGSKSWSYIIPAFLESLSISALVSLKSYVACSVSFFIFVTQALVCSRFCQDSMDQSPPFCTG